MGVDICSVILQTLDIFPCFGLLMIALWLYLSFNHASPLIKNRIIMKRILIDDLKS